MTWTLHHGDCLAGLRTLADKSVDVVLTDPPYDDHTHKAGRSGHLGAGTAENGGESSKRATFNRVRDLGFAALTSEQMTALAIEFARVSKRWVLIFCTVEMVSDWKRNLEAAGLQYVRTCAWHKLGSTPQFSGDRPAVAFECIVVAHRPGRKRWNGGGKHGFYEHPIVLNRGAGEIRVHTTQKPLALMRELVEDFTEPGELILDPFAGSGSTGVACGMLGRRFVGWELDENYYEIARRRLSGERAKPIPSQPELF